MTDEASSTDKEPKNDPFNMDDIDIDLDNLPDEDPSAYKEDSND